MAAARAAGYGALRLDTHPAGMAAAVALYRDLGFLPTEPYEDAAPPEIAHFQLDL
jgi:hypothetical protein